MATDIVAIADGTVTTVIERERRPRCARDHRARDRRRDVHQHLRAHAVRLGRGRRGPVGQGGRLHRAARQHGQTPRVLICTSSCRVNGAPRSTHTAGSPPTSADPRSCGCAVAVQAESLGSGHSGPSSRTNWPARPDPWSIARSAERRIGVAGAGSDPAVSCTCPRAGADLSEHLTIGVRVSARRSQLSALG